MSYRKLLGAAVMSMVAGFATAAPFPERELSGVIMWGAGGAMDVVSRAVTPYAEQALGKKIVLVNKAGGTGAISTNFVNNAPADGYTLLYGAENPQLHQVLGLADFGYEKFYPVIVFGRGVAVIVVAKDAPWNTVKEFVEDAKKRPGKLKMGSTGPGGLPHTVGSMLNSVTKFQVISVPFDGEGPGLTALMGGHVDMMPVGAGAATENIKAGRVKALAVVDAAAMPIAGFPSIPPITADYPEFGKFLPWGPFYGVFVKRDTPDDIKATLVKAFKTAGDNPQFQTLMGGHVDMMPVGAGAATENIKAGRVKALAVVDAAAMPIAGFPSIAPITTDYPEFAKFLPWGPFYGVFVKRDTPDDVKATLVKAFKTAGDNPQFQTLMKERGNVLMNLSGAEADAFMKKWQSVTGWVLQDVGAAKISPEKFGIPRP